MTHSLYLSIIGAVVFFAAYIILRLLRDNERLIAELDWAESKAMALDADFDEAIQSNEKANAYIEQLSELLDEAWRANKECDTDIQMLNDHIKVLNKRLTKYNNEAKGYEISLNALDAEHRKTIQHLYGRIGAMQRKINRLKNQE